MGSKLSKTGKKGGVWKSKVYFDLESDSPRGEGYHINDEQLLEKMGEIIDESEYIQKIWVYKKPLSSWLWIFHHQFVVLETSAWWWSIEKNGEGITIQRSRGLSYVKDYYRRTERIKPIEEVNSDQGRMKMKDLIEFLYQENELNKPYHFMNENCQHFAKRIFDKFAKAKFL